jgi:hypothetical protein
MTTPQKQAAPAAPAAPAAAPLPEAWSTGYAEEKDTFEDFDSFAPPAAEPTTPGTPMRQLSSRMLSGQFEDEHTKAWEEDWDDEDVDDTFDRTMERIARS